ncbi:MAG: EamA family transporter [Alphaproteobacteria bacterium]|nr:EamA family transporter [Alphaproteobacteria bacterium]
MPAGQRRATLVGGLAVLMWSALALLTTAAGPVPPFQLLSLTFALGALLAGLKWWWQGQAGWRHLVQPLPVWLLGVGGLFGYHAVYFTALGLAPPAEASLIAYLWPMLIVLFAALLPGGRLAARHVAGALLGLLATILLVAPAGGQLGAGAPLGYLAAAACAVIWSAYSVAWRRHAEVPSDAVAGFLAVSAVLGAVAHLGFERTVWPTDLVAWLAVVGLGLGPVGAAFFCWDYGVKRGDLQLLGVLAYATPVLSTLALVAVGMAEASLHLGLACLLIVAAAALAGGLARRSSQKAVANPSQDRSLAVGQTDGGGSG